jgi:hypothetical protein
VLLRTTGLARAAFCQSCASDARALAPTDLKKLLDAKAYSAHCEAGGH